MYTLRLSLLLCLLICSGCSTTDYYSHSYDQLRQAYINEQRQSKERSNFQDSNSHPRQNDNTAILSRDWRRERNNPTLSGIERAADYKGYKF